MPHFGFAVAVEKFFPVQGGVFHIVMAVVYSLAGYHKLRQESLILVSVIAKYMATLFLVTYALFVQAVWMVWISALGDLIMGSVILWAWRSCRSQDQQAIAQKGS